MRLTQPADLHAVLLRVEIVPVAGTAPVHKSHASLPTEVEVPAWHGGAAWPRLGGEGAHGCQGTAVRASRHLGATERRHVPD